MREVLYLFKMYHEILVTLKELHVFTKSSSTSRYLDVIMFGSPVFHNTFWTDKVLLSSTNQVIFGIVQLSPFHFIPKIFLIWWQLKFIWSRWEIDVSYVGPEKFFFATLCGAFSLNFWFCVFDHSLWLFSSHGFHTLCRLSSILFPFSLVFSFLVLLVFSFALLILVLSCFCSLYRLTFFFLPPYDFQWIGDFEGVRVRGSNWSREEWAWS